ncbi:energy-coupling factor ABC transporter permease [Veronia pacifica]|uniref:Uncharacterized protein n=1 Tax=Veronia pacifica TaxID=1080227 RepID=A0A1C3EDV9_9GAMM|nr:energy-coupling factor ABC transporter permease [Veronia pacifica]ODA31394.1 hypothetical protein A8L45_17095 [Veronia pacifica]
MEIVQTISWMLFLAVLWFCWPAEGLNKLRQDKGYQHLVFGTSVLLFFLWGMKAGIREGLDIHFLGLVVLTLSHGARTAVWICAAVLLSMLLLGMVPLQEAGLFSLTHMVIPIFFSYLIFLLSYHLLPHHLFVYIFVAGFFNAGLTLILHQCLVAGWYWLADIHTWKSIWHDYLRLSLLMWFPEALLSGMAITLMTIYRPQWLKTYSDRDYLSPS